LTHSKESFVQESDYPAPDHAECMNNNFVCELNYVFAQIVLLKNVSCYYFVAHCVLIAPLSIHATNSHSQLLFCQGAERFIIGGALQQTRHDLFITFFSTPTI